MRPVTVTAIQLPAWQEGETPEEIKAANVRRILAGLEAAGERGSDLAVLGECSNVMHLPIRADTIGQYADPVPGELTAKIATAARRCRMNVVAPLIASCNGRFRNAAVIFDRAGEIVGCYYKVHLPAPEADWGVVAGDGFPVFTLDFGRIGIMICMDIEYPEHATALMLNGAEIMIFPHVQGSWGEVDWEIRYRSRAIDTGLYLVSACYGVRDDEQWMPGQMIGRSGIIGRDGGILAEAGRYAGLVTATLDLDRERVTNFHFAKLCPRTAAIKASRRPEIYGRLTDPSTREDGEREAAAAMARLNPADKA